MPACITCPALHPARDPAWADVGQICAADYGTITSWLGDIADMFAQLLTPEAIRPDTRTWWRPWRDRRGQPIIIDGAPLMREEVYADPVGALLPVGPVRGASGQPRVSGGAERPLGVATPIGHLDLMLPVSIDTVALRRGPRAGDWWEPQVRAWSTPEAVDYPPTDGTEGPVHQVTVQVWHRELARDPNGDVIYVPCGDQVGDEPVARMLDRAAQGMLLAGAPGRMLPEPNVPAATAWIRDRLDWAVNYYRDLDQFATELKRAHGALRRALGEGEDQPEPIRGVRCGMPRCLKKNLVRYEGRIECRSCERTYTEQQLEELEDVQRKNTKAIQRRAA